MNKNRKVVKKRNESQNVKELQRENNSKFNKRNSSKNQRRMKEAEDTLLHVSATNDYSWYSKFPQFTKDTGTLPFGLPVGQPYSLSNSEKLVTPGVYILKYTPGVGPSSDLTSPVNRMSAKFYTYLRNVQKAAAKYDSADIMMYLMALDSCYSFHAFLRRAYGIANLYTPLNKYYPRVLLRAMGIDTSILNNLAEFRAYINQYGISLGSFCLPTSFDISVRHQWMCEGLYVDSETTRAQTYAFVPNGFWKFNNTVETGSELDWVDWMGTASTPKANTLDDIRAIGKTLMNAILLDQDTGNISGDLYAYFKPENLMKVREVEDGYMVLPSYNKVVLSQINNASIVGEHEAWYTPVISQNPAVNNGAIIYKPKFDGGFRYEGTWTLTGVNGRNVKVLNAFKDSPTPEEVIEMTRLSVCSTDNIKVFNRDAYNDGLNAVFGSDVINRVFIWTYSGNTSFKSLSTKTETVFFNPVQTVDQIEARVDLLCLNACFDWAPLIWKGKALVDDSGTIVGADIQYAASDVDNLTLVTHEQLAMMHEAALLSMLDVPDMGR